MEQGGSAGKDGSADRSVRDTLDSATGGLNAAKLALDSATGQLLIELAFLIPVGDQAAFTRIGERLVAYHDRLVDVIKAGAEQPSTRGEAGPSRARRDVASPAGAGSPQRGERRAAGQRSCESDDDGP